MGDFRDEELVSQVWRPIGNGAVPRQVMLIDKPDQDRISSDRPDTFLDLRRRARTLAGTRRRKAKIVEVYLGPGRRPGRESTARRQVEVAQLGADRRDRGSGPRLVGTK